MNYLRLLDEARTRLDRGDLLAAEDSLRRAREAWSKSKFRAPLVEKGIEPVLRRAGRWFGRRSENPVLPVFGHLVARLEEDLTALAGLLRDEALDLARHPAEGQGQRELDLLERALLLDRESRVFDLERDARWSVTRSYLQVGRRLARPARAELLPDDLATPEQLPWLGEWAQAWLGAGAIGDARVLRWVHRQTASAARLEGDDSPAAARWWWLAARAALCDPHTGTEALEGVRRALTCGLQEPDRQRALRSLASLLANERLLAGPGADVAALFEAHAPFATGQIWPPPEVQTLLDARRLDPREVGVVAAAWSDDGGELALVVHRGGRALDALVLRPRREPDPTDPFAAALPEARGWIHRWLPERAVVLVPTAPPGPVEAVLGDRPRLVLDETLRRLGEVAGDDAPEAAALSHPLWDGVGAPGTWEQLADRARRLVPVLRSLLDRSPAFHLSWGRRNLQVLAEHGLTECAGLVLAVEALMGDARDVHDTPAALQRADVGVPLQWPVLSDRDWPLFEIAEGEEPIESEAPASSWAEAGSDVWVGRVGSSVELAVAALARGRVEVLTAGKTRAHAIAARAAARADARTVSVAPDRVACAEPWLALLERWIGAALLEPERQLDVLWLLRALCQTPVGDPQAWLRGRDDAVFAEVERIDDAAHRCPDGCRLGRHGGCWPAQLAGRREQAAVWVVDVLGGRDVLDSPAGLLLDDPRAWVCEVDGAVAEQALEHALARSAHAEQTSLWMGGGPLVDALLEAWRRRLTRPRPLSRRPPAPALAAVETFAVPSGYRPGDPLLAAEAERLLALRAEVFTARDADEWWWTCASARIAPPRSRVVRGVASAPAAATVVCAELGDASYHSDLLLLLRASAAISHTRTRAVVLDPRLAAVLGQADGWRPAVADDDPLPLRRVERALQSGARLLEGRAGSALPDWGSPLTLARLRTVSQTTSHVELAPSRGQALAHGLRESARGRGVVVAGARDAERRLVIDTVRALAEASGDGGPLGVRCVVVIGAPPHWRATDARARSLASPVDRQLGTVVLEVERGGVTRIDLPTEALDDDDVLGWARRAPAVAWFLVRAERDLDVDPLLLPGDADERAARGRVRAARLADALERSGARLFAWTDEVGAAAERIARAFSGGVCAVHEETDADSVSVHATATPAPEIACPHCEATMSVPDPFAICPACARRAWTRALGRARALHAVERAMERRLRGESDRGPWWALAFESDVAHRLRDRLGLQPFDLGEAPLLAASDHDPRAVPTVMPTRDLWDQRGPAPAVFLVGAPESRSHLRAVFARLRAMGDARPRVEILLAPVGLEDRSPLPDGGRWQWTAARTEVEFRLRDRLRVRTGVREDVLAGLGPGATAPRLDRESTEALDALLGVPRPSEVVAAAAEQAFVDLEQSGLLFGAQRAVALDRSIVRLHEGMLEWALAEGLLRRDPPPAHARRTSTDLLGAREWERALRRLEIGGSSSLAELPDATSLHEIAGDPVSAPGSARKEGLAGTGKSSWLRDQVARARDRGERVLVVVPHASARIGWSRIGGRRIDVVTAEEIALAFLRRVVHDDPDVTIRLLPSAGRADADELRLRLMRETSRRYAASAGSVPAVEAKDLRRVVEGEPVELGLQQRDEVDLELLVSCAREVRRLAGWLTTGELLEQCRRWTEREREVDIAWSTRYPVVAVDDAHHVHPELLHFLRELLAASVWWVTTDPTHGAVSAFQDLPLVGEVAMTSTRLPKEWIRAIETLWRDAPALPGRPRSARKGREAGRLRVERVLNLRAAADWILADIDAERAPDRTAVVRANEGDRMLLAQYLRDGGLEVRLADRTARWCAPGPREVLACLHLLVGPERDEDLRERLLACVLGPAHEASVGSARAFLSSLDDRLHRAGSEGVALDPDEARVVALARCARALTGELPVQEAVRVLLRSGVLDPLLAVDASVGRLQELVGMDADLRVDDVLNTVPAVWLAEPFGPSRAIWILSPDDLAGSRFDHVLHVCTGFESAPRHYDVLACADQAFSLLYSERDPLG